MGIFSFLLRRKTRSPPPVPSKEPRRTTQPSRQQVPRLMPEPLPTTLQATTTPPAPSAGTFTTPPQRTAGHRRVHLNGKRVLLIPLLVLRQLRVFDTQGRLALGKSAMPWEIPPDVPAEYQAVLTLMNAQDMRMYKEGTFAIPAFPLPPPPFAETKPVLLGIDAGVAWDTVRGLLSGCELSIWQLDHDENPLYVNLIDLRVELFPQERMIRVLTDLVALYPLKFASSSEMELWFAAIKLLQFEYVHLAEALTAAILSREGPRLNDIVHLLSRSYHHADWCDIRLPYVLPKWLQVYMVVTPGSGKKPGNVLFYTSDRVLLRNLVVLVDTAHSAYAVYPRLHRLISQLALMKVHGDVRLHEKYASEFDLGPPGAQQATRLTSFMAGFTRSSLRNLFTSELGLELPPGSPGRRSRSGTATLFLLPADGKRLKFRDFDLMYIMPKSHGGVKPVETMVRLYLPLINALHLYGKPHRLLSERLSVGLLVFALPTLPRCLYMTSEDAAAVVHAALPQWQSDHPDEFTYWNHKLGDYLLDRMLLREGYQGVGRITEQFQELAFGVAFGQVFEESGDLMSFGEGDKLDLGSQIGLSSVRLRLATWLLLQLPQQLPQHQHRRHVYAQHEGSLQWDDEPPVPSLVPPMGEQLRLLPLGRYRQDADEPGVPAVFATAK